MTIKDFIIDITLADLKNRLQERPSQEIKDQIQSLESGVLRVNGDTELLKVQYKDHVMKSGDNKPYISFNGGEFRYFPQARYGRSISR